MARRSEDSCDSTTPGWLLTFSDMVTLLLTFFVLIISITTTDPKSLAVSGQDIAFSQDVPPDDIGPGLLDFSNPMLIAPVVEMIENLSRIPPDVMLDQRELKAAIFQLDPASQPDYQELEQEVRDSVSIFRDERGLVIRWDKAVIFPEGTAVLREETLPLLQKMASLLARLSWPVSVDAYTNPDSEMEGGSSALAYRLSAQRARVVMDYFTGLGLPASRFRLGAFGGSRPVTADPAQGARNSRLEIVIYQPPQSSWKG
ncbi:MAG: OmpA family protein [Deltaproteobacteria bacterium]|jgi:chemotaxis protein MotB|nr:OmpA family protein [Deltaproteobacteria bacterium]